MIKSNFILKKRNKRKFQQKQKQLGLVRNQKMTSQSSKDASIRIARSKKTIEILDGVGLQNHPNMGVLGLQSNIYTSGFVTMMDNNLMHFINLDYNTFCFSNSFVDVNRLEDVESNLYFYNNAKFVSFNNNVSKDSQDNNPMQENVHLDADHFKDSIFLQVSKCIALESDNNKNREELKQGVFGLQSNPNMGVLGNELLTDLADIEEYAQWIWKIQSHNLFVKNLFIFKLYLNKQIKMPKIEAGLLDSSISESSHFRLSQLFSLFFFRNHFKVSASSINREAIDSLVNIDANEFEKSKKSILNEEDEDDISISSNPVLQSHPNMGVLGLQSQYSRIPAESKTVVTKDSYLYSDLISKSSSFMLIKKYLSALNLIKNLTLEIITKKERNNLSICLKNIKYNIFTGTVGLFKLREKRSRSKRKEMNAPSLMKRVKIKSIPQLPQDGSEEAFALKKKFMISKPTSLFKLLKANLFKYESCLNLYRYMNIKMHEYSGAFDPANTPAYLQNSGKMLSRSELTSSVSFRQAESKTQENVYNYIMDNPKKISYPWMYNYDAIGFGLQSHPNMGVLGLQSDPLLPMENADVTQGDSSMANIHRLGLRSKVAQDLKANKKSYEIHSISMLKPKTFELLKIYKITKERHGGTKIGK